MIDKVREAFEAHWSRLVNKGDPRYRANPSREDFAAGWAAAVEACERGAVDYRRDPWAETPTAQERAVVEPIVDHTCGAIIRRIRALSPENTTPPNPGEDGEEA